MGPWENVRLKISALNNENFDFFMTNSLFHVAKRLFGKKTDILPHGNRSLLNALILKRTFYPGVV